jgi:hypothetical protein
MLFIWGLKLICLIKRTYIELDGERDAEDKIWSNRMLYQLHLDLTTGLLAPLVINWKNRWKATLCSEKKISQIGRLAYWLRKGETDVSELRPLRAFCSFPADCHVNHGWYWLGLSQLGYQSVLAATSTLWFPAILDVSGASGRWANEMRI